MIIIKDETFPIKFSNNLIVLIFLDIGKFLPTFKNEECAPEFTYNLKDNFVSFLSIIEKHILFQSFAIIKLEFIFLTSLSFKHT